MHLFYIGALCSVFITEHPVLQRSIHSPGQGWSFVLHVCMLYCVEKSQKVMFGYGPWHLIHLLMWRMDGHGFNVPTTSLSNGQMSRIFCWSQPDVMFAWTDPNIRDVLCRRAWHTSLFWPKGTSNVQVGHQGHVPKCDENGLLFVTLCESSQTSVYIYLHCNHDVTRRFPKSCIEAQFVCLQWSPSHRCSTGGTALTF